MPNGRDCKIIYLYIIGGSQNIAAGILTGFAVPLKLFGLCPKLYKMKLYMDYMSQVSRAVYIFMKINNIHFEVERILAAKGR